MVCWNEESLQQQGTHGHDTKFRPSKVQVFLAAVMLFAVTPLAEAAQPPKRGSGASVVQVSNQVLPPLAHARFCLAYPDQCTYRRGATFRKLSSGEQLAELVRINLTVNKEIAPQEDGITGGRGDEWTVDATRGDCEDYAILKRKRLLAMGWPSSKLRIATALTKDGTGHAVLIARVNRRDVVLDNLTGAIRLWNETGYRFLKIQSDTDPSAWFAVRNLETQAGQLS